LKNMPEKSPFSKLFHIGIMVNDIEKTARRLESLGFEKFEPMEDIPSFDGRAPMKDVKGLLARIGDMEIELFDPPKEESAFKKYRETKGEGIHHLGFLVSDLDSEIAGLARQGIQPKLRGRSEQQEWSDYDTGFGDCLFQLIKR
jgi:methylmalonyl-CoA/ethylmalonyl-CoA epimerase